MNIKRILCCAALLSAGCTLNPATGQRQLTLISEQQEIAMGHTYDKQITAELGLYPDQELQDYVNDLGSRLAAKSERPNLPWTFRVVDDPMVNAFAVPGGHIYVTRGMLVHSGSEAQLASVIGHEIGHVTARHSVEQMSRAQLAQLGFGVAMMASEEFRDYAGIAQIGMQLMFLKFSRNDERQADDLGLRYMGRGGFDPNEMPKMFEMLSSQSDLHGGQRLPSWQSTHPDPDRRGGRIRKQIAALPEDARSGTINQHAYLKRLDGMVFGTNPREGYTMGSTFIQPDMKFRVDFPKGWKIINQKQSVTALSPDKNAIIVLSLAKGASLKHASDLFFEPEEIERGNQWRKGFYDFRTVPQPDPSTGASQSVRGSVGFFSHDQNIIRLVAYTPAETWKANAKTARRSLRSFKRVTDKRLLNVQPAHIKIVTLNRSMSLQEFNRNKPSSIDLESLAVLNNVDQNHTFAKGDLVKRVVGGKLPKK